MLFLMLLLGCETKDPLQACINAYKAGCDCGYEYQSCEDSYIEKSCTDNLEFADVDESNCLVRELRGCSGENWDETYEAAKKACGMTTAD